MESVYVALELVKKKIPVYLFIQFLFSVINILSLSFLYLRMMSQRRNRDGVQRLYLALGDRTM